MRKARKLFFPLSTQAVWWLWPISLLIVVASMATLQQSYWTPTVGIFAAISAVFAATLAYNAATEKVTYDREVHHQKEYERKITIFINAEQMATAIAERMSHLSAIHDFTVDWSQDNANSLPEVSLRFERPSQLSEIWSSVGVLPPKAITELRRLTADIDSFLALTAREVERAQNNPANFYMSDGSPSERMIRLRPKAAARIASLGSALKERAIVFAAIMSREIPFEELTQDERNILRHGQPD
ncbi:hypothetical protein [Ferrovibrio sp.]|uniref:hypothetical protein n=1 Tax=Ferrovibrio sp. TaxID=1917215 RepID=UPI00311FA4AE